MAKNKIIVEIVTNDKGTTASIKNQEKLAKFVAKKLGVPEDLLRNKEEMNQAIQMMQQMQSPSSPPQGE